MLSFMHPLDALAAPPLYRLAHAELLARALDAEPSHELEARQDADGYSLTLAAPGVPAKDVSVEVARREVRVAIAGRRKRARPVRLPDDADLASATATHADGLLSVSVPRVPKPEPRELSVEGAAAVPMDDEEGDEACYRVEVAAPGVRLADLRVTAEDGRRLKIAGETSTARGRAAVHRTLLLPKDAGLEHATAAYADGLLRVAVPVKRARPDDEPRQLEIQTPATGEPAAAPPAEGEASPIPQSRL